MTVLLRDDPSVIERYKAEHRKVWPEVILALRESGVQRMNIYLYGRQLFMHIEADDAFDPHLDVARASFAARCTAWNELMASLQEPPSETGGGWVTLETVFNLDSV